MSGDEASKFVNELENKYPVNSWQIDGIHIWPMIKVKIFFASDRGAQMDNTKGVNTVTLSSILKGFWSYCLFTIRKSYKANHLYCNAPHFRYKQNGQYINRYFNGLMENYRLDTSFLFLEYGNVNEDYRKNIEYPEQTLFVEDIKYAALALRNLQYFFKSKIHWPSFDLFCKEVQDKLGNNKINEKSIIKQYLYINILKKYYKQIIKKYQVENIYALCYYVSETYAMNLAAAECNIDLYDIQHGGQGERHVAYSNYNLVPKSGYKLLPKKFWCWDQASANVINDWVNKQEFHNVDVKGNPWIEHCNKVYRNLEFDDSKIILYTMQPLGEFLLEPYIIETIKNTPLHYKWWLRLHPRQLNQKTKLLELLKENGILSKVELDLSTELPLPVILNNVHMHISKSSGSILESYMLHKKSIIISETGVAMYPDVVKSNYGLVTLTESPAELLDLILNS